MEPTAQRNCLAFEGGAWNVTPPRVERHADGRSFSARYHLQRRPAYYLIKVDLIVALLTALSFFSYNRAIEGFGSQLEILLTLILAVVVYLYVVQEGLPKVAYLTLLDEHCLGRLLFPYINLDAYCVPGYPGTGTIR